ncbi:MAG: response regulator transcription factor [Rhodoferax sp.]|uniref:response regulator transcription factor n=1 Tax=Rhodoferax sp. TaxID=50421 RepID=UPI00271F981F|nr:response regulator transcription factor [Rhodoferax sp.]MDO8449097.1 response regulator transcription factor [Rhodoferax sp.]
MSTDLFLHADGPRCIYVLDDDPDICRLVSSTLREFGFEVVECHNAATLRRLLLARVPDLCIVDLGLPDADGMDVVRDLQARFACGVMVLTGRGYLSDRVMGLELGADDYVVKPFEPRELVARVRSILRRRDKPHNTQTQMPVRSQLAEFGGWHFRVDSNTLSSPGGQEWTLSAGESRMLLQFLQRPNRILDREQLCGDRDLSALDRGVDVRVSRLRRKLESDSQQPKTIRTVYGAGYLLAAEVRWL